VTQVENIAPGLRRWTAWHEEWKDEVGSLAVDTDDGVVLIDPIDLPRGLARADHVLLTVFWHGRSTGEVTGAEVWASKRGVRRLKNRGVDVTESVEDAQLPGGIRAIPTARDSEVVYWLPQQKAVVVGDVLLGAGAKPKATDVPLRLCPERWLDGKSHDDLRVSLRPLLELPVQRVLVSHGKPILRGGKKALAAVIA
jgi:glyoxylase-like metal-dependent hydrolase (beta-lactamase superfamily II)